MNNLLAARRNFDSERGFFRSTKRGFPPLSQQPVRPFSVGVSVKGENSGERGFGLLTRPSTVHDSITETGLQLAARPTTFPQPFFFLALYLGLPEWSVHGLLPLLLLNLSPLFLTREKPGVVRFLFSLFPSTLPPL